MPAVFDHRINFAMLARSTGVGGARVEHAAELEGALEAAINAGKPYLVEIRPVGTSTWALPPLPPCEPNFTRLARGR